MFIDTHAHLVGEKNVDAIISDAAANGVGAIVCATAHPDDWAPALELANRHKNVFVTLGIHPEYAVPPSPASPVLPPQAVGDNSKVIGIGEIGLDYHPSPDGAEASPSACRTQIELFERMLDVARNAALPVAIHSRDAEEDTARILRDINGVMHCFTGTWDFARVMLDRGFYFSASGIITFKNADELREVFAKIPTDRIVIETDAPYCAPVPHRGKECTPGMIVETARVLANLKNLQLDELEYILEQNTKNLYPKLTI